MIFRATALKKVSVSLLPFSDAVSEDLPLSQLLRLSLFQVSVGMAAVMVGAQCLWLLASSRESA